jgi:quercetin dioxygenase-like cupin family protein
MTEMLTERPPTAVPEPRVVSGGEETLWFLGTVARMKLGGDETGGRFALWEGVLPHDAAPPLHSHPQDETFYVLEGEVTAWLVEPELADDDTDLPGWVKTRGRRCGPGAVIFAPAGRPHTFRIESDTARMLFLSTPAGVEEYVRALAEPAQWPWLQPPADGPRIPAERMKAVERQLGMVRHGPPPPPSGWGVGLGQDKSTRTIGGPDEHQD